MGAEGVTWGQLGSGTPIMWGRGVQIGVWGGQLGSGTLSIGGKGSRNGVWGGHLGSVGVRDPPNVG